MNVFTNPIFTDETKAREWLEARLWPHGPVCPHCGVIDNAVLMQGKTTRAGLYKCRDCREPFTVTMGTIYERSHVPLNKWLAATQLLMSSKKGMSALQVSRMLDVTRRTAWFLMHRIRETLRETGSGGLLGGENKVVEADETWVGGKAKNRKNHVPPKEAVFALVERDGRVRSHHVADVSGKTLKPILQAHMDKASYLMTDESTVYPTIAKATATGHGTVNHSIEEYVRGGFWHTNTVEGYFSILKRGITGTYHSVSQQHLKRYLAEFDFRYNEREALGVNDTDRMEKTIAGVVGKRLTYRRTCGEQTA